MAASHDEHHTTAAPLPAPPAHPALLADPATATQSRRATGKTPAAAGVAPQWSASVPRRMGTLDTTPFRVYTVPLRTGENSTQRRWVLHLLMLGVSLAIVGAAAAWVRMNWR